MKEGQMQINFDGRKLELDGQAVWEIQNETADLMDTDVELREDYSGRGMYGDTCVGIVGRAGVEIAFAFAVMKVIKDNDLSINGDNDEYGEVPTDLYAFLALNCRSDNMGLDMIYYWPGIQAI